MIELINDLYIDIEYEQRHVDIKPYETYNYVLCRKIKDTYIRTKAFLKIEVELICSSILVSGVEHSDSVFL